MHRISGPRRLHGQSVQERLPYHCTMGAGRPPRTRLTRPANGEGRYVQQAGGRGQYGHVKIRIYPGQPGSGFVWENTMVPGAIPSAFIAAIELGLRETARAGVPAGCPLEDVRIELE